MHLILFDDPVDRIRLYPLTLTRPISSLRLGILTIAEKWRMYLPEASVEVDTESYLKDKFGVIGSTSRDTLWVNARCLPDVHFLESLKNLQQGHSLEFDDQLIAFRGERREDANRSMSIVHDEDLITINKSWDLFLLNGAEIRKDYDLLTQGRQSADISDPHTIVYGRENIFLEEGVTIRASILNAEDGPIYIGKDAVISEGSLIRGPFALCEGSVVSMGTKVRGDSTIGPFSKVGGEVSNSIFIGYSNKSHDGFIGNSILGEWCNLGAGTNTSNLKNNYGPVRMWDYETERLQSTGLQFCGLVMGDHSKSAIGTNFNTGTTVGVCANVFAAGFPGNFLPSFTWGGQRGAEVYQIDKTFETAERVMMRRNLSLSPEDKAILTYIFEHLSY
ncbi:GlmU family protein [Marinoscillum sp. MHG1-6]|uniref:GlmU family protein n=1 Tax=Marinoscillum sp. MHG1-6 TaxID=2959627 RepID=UPI002157C355|nr:GlmU family protein [Marinoscillum sp. MHG1-6]